MSVQKEEKAALMAEHARSEGDTGSVEVQVAILTRRIKNLTAHLQKHRKDVSTRRGLVSMVAKRSSLLKYLKKKDATRHAELIQKLGIRG